MADLDWRRAYQAHQDLRRGHLVDARRRGATFFRLGDRGQVVDPSKLSDRQIADIVLRDAERVVNKSIIEHNEQVGAS